MTVIARPIPPQRRLPAAVASSLGVALVTGFATVMLFFVGAGAPTATLAQLVGYFLGASIVLFVVLFVFATVGMYRNRYLALLGSILGAAIAAVLGSVLTVLTGGQAMTGSILGQIIVSLAGPNLIFIVVAAVAAVTVGAALWHRLLRDLDAAERRVAFVRAPAAGLASGIVTHIERSAVDIDLADRQWDDYVKALVDNDWRIVEVPLADGMPDSVFIEDTVVLFGDTAVIASPGAESRREEIVEAEKTYREAGLRIERITLPGALEGGDVLKVGTTVYVGRGGRTNAEGIRQLRSIVARLGYTVVAVPLTKALHLKSAVTALPDGTVIGYAPVVDSPAIFERFIAMPEEGGAHVVVLSPDTVLMAASAPRSADIIRDLGYRVVVVDISEFEKLEGCVTCLSVRLR
jgi:dimethylargininase